MAVAAVGIDGRGYLAHSKLWILKVLNKPKYVINQLKQSPELRFKNH